MHTSTIVSPINPPAPSILSIFPSVQPSHRIATHRITSYDTASSTIPFIHASHQIHPSTLPSTNAFPSYPIPSVIHPYIDAPIPSMHRSTPSSIHPTIHPFIRPSVHPSIHHSPIHQSMHASNLSIHPSICPCIHPSVHPPIHQSSMRPIRAKPNNKNQKSLPARPGARIFTLRRAQGSLRHLEHTIVTPQEVLNPSPVLPKDSLGSKRTAPRPPREPQKLPQAHQNDRQTSPETIQGASEASARWPKSLKDNRKSKKRKTSYFTISQHLVFYEMRMTPASGTSLFTMRQRLRAQGLSRAIF